MQSQRIEHSTFLQGLRQYINALKKLRRDPILSERLLPHLQNYNYELLNHHLPSGICKGYALSAALSYEAPHIQGFKEYYQKIGSFAQLSISQVQNWILVNQDKAQTLISYSNQFMMYHRIGTNYKSIGVGHVVTLTANLKRNQLQGFFPRFALTALKIYNNNNHYGAILIGSGEHKISVNVWRDENDKDFFRLNDANGNLLCCTGEVATLVRMIEEQFEQLNRYDGECMSYVFDILTTNSPDDVFNGILERLKNYVNLLPEYLDSEVAVNPNKPCLMRNLPFKALLTRLIEKYEKGQSRVGFLEDVLLYFNDPILREFRLFKCPMEEEIKGYLQMKSRLMDIILKLYQENINLPSRNGYSWLHLAILTGEMYVAWKLLKEHKANPSLELLFKSKEQKFAKPNMKSLVLLGNTDPKPLKPDEDVEILDTAHTHSDALHAAAIRDDLELYEELVRLGANPKKQAGNRQTAEDLIRPNGQIAKSILSSVPSVSGLFGSLFVISGMAGAGHALIHRPHP